MNTEWEWDDLSDEDKEFLRRRTARICGHDVLRPARWYEKLWNLIRHGEWA